MSRKLFSLGGMLVIAVGMIFLTMEPAEAGRPGGFHRGFHHGGFHGRYHGGFHRGYHHRAYDHPRYTREPSLLSLLRQPWLPS